MLKGKNQVVLGQRLDINVLKSEKFHIKQMKYEQNNNRNVKTTSDQFRSKRAYLYT